VEVKVTRSLYGENGMQQIHRPCIYPCYLYYHRQWRKTGYLIAYLDRELSYEFWIQVSVLDQGYNNASRDSKTNQLWCARPSMTVSSSAVDDDDVSA